MIPGKMTKSVYALDVENILKAQNKVALMEWT